MNKRTTIIDQRIAVNVLLLVLAGACSDREDFGDPESDTDAAILADIGYATGLDDAPVTVIEFSDFGCPYCAQFALDTYPDVHGEFVLSGRVRWVYVPFVLGTFPNSEAATRAAECAGSQDRFWQMHDLLFDRQREWRRAGPQDTLFLELAEAAGTRGVTFRECFESDAPGERIARHNQLARRLGVRATPTFLVNGRLIQGALSPEYFRALLEWAHEEG